MTTLGYPGSKISLKVDGVPTLFPVVETMLMPPIRRIQAATWASTTTFPQRSNELLARIQVMSALCEFG